MGDIGDKKIEMMKKQKPHTNQQQLERQYREQQEIYMLDNSLSFTNYGFRMKKEDRRRGGGKERERERE